MGGKPRIGLDANESATTEQIQAADEWVAMHVAAGAREIVGEELRASRTAAEFKADLGADYQFPVATAEDDESSYMVALEGWRSRIHDLQVRLREKLKTSRETEKALIKLIAATKEDKALSPALKPALEVSVREAAYYSMVVAEIISSVCILHVSDKGRWVRESQSAAAFNLFRLGVPKSRIAKLLDVDRRDVTRWLGKVNFIKGELVRES